MKHNVAHHTYTNSTATTPNHAGAVREARARAAPAPLVSAAALLHLGAVRVMALRWQTVGDIAAFSRGSIGTSALRMPRGWDLAGSSAGR